MHCMRNLPSSEEDCIAWAQQHGLLPRRRLCPRHRQPMRLLQAVARNPARFRCTKGQRHGIACRDRSLRQGTWFENVHLNLEQIIWLMYAFAHNWTYALIVHELRDISLPLEQQTKLSQHTVTIWSAYYREIITESFLKLQVMSDPLGGPETVVQIDESEFGKRNHSRGRLVEGHWVVGMIQDGTDEVRVFVVERRDAETLQPLIQQHVRPGTTIRTDTWEGYQGLGDLGYTHTINHNDQDHSLMNQKTRIETWFRGFRRVSSEAFGDQLCEYLWRRRVRKHKLDPMETILEAIRSEYGDLR